ncbi:MAG: hypothetical protein MRK02_15255 [Candidatus Scalindua sp.]|nr:hypothetical protein [Candidatus Scalindua sp.]
MITDIQPENSKSQEELKKRVYGRPFKKGNKFATKEYRKPKKDEDVSLTSYINSETNQGQLMADFYIGVLKALKNNRNGDKITYRGIAIGAELVKAANELLTVNWIGKPGRRAQKEERDDRPVEEKIKEITYLVDKFGYYLIKKDNAVSEISELGYRCEKI